MSRLRTQRGSIRRSFTRAYNELKDEHERDNRNNSVLRSLWRKAEDRFDQLTKIDENIMQELSNQDISEEDMDEEFNTVQEYRDKWNELNLIINSETTHEDNRSVITPVDNNNGKSRYKLPKLKLVEFSGSPKEWLNFWSQFKGIHEDANLTAEEKFQYLIQATVIESVARRVVSSFPPTGENYNKAIEHLKSRFGKERVLVEVYVRDLLKLVLSNTNGNQKLSLATLYDKLETQLRSLESLGVTTDKYAAMLYPLVESALPEDVLVAWERNRNQRNTAEEGDEDQLKQLMRFLRGEVESNIRLTMAKHGIISDDETAYEPTRKQPKLSFETITTTDLFNRERSIECIFCGRPHHSKECLQELTMSQKYEKLKKAGRCFRCLTERHLARTCRSSVKCPVCHKNHYQILCNQKYDPRPLRKINELSTYKGVNEVIFQTVIIILNGEKVRQPVRALIDSASGKSYITSQAIKILGIESLGTIELVHTLFGGVMTNSKKHAVYNVDISNEQNTFQRQFQLLEVDKICNSVSPTPDGPWMDELARENMILSDNMKEQHPIHVLFGADTSCKLYVGKIFETQSGPVAFKTRFGWSLTGSTGNDVVTTPENNILLIHSLYISNARIQDLWNLDIIGIHDPVEGKSKQELTQSALVHFKKNVKQRADGRYEVALPWIEDHQAVAVNRDIAERRLYSSMTKLKRLGKLESYQKIFDEWISMGIIERVPEDEYDKQEVSYLPHHPVFNEKSLTTPIRPVFDASARSKGSPSLNDCLEKGLNLLQEIPALLILFRMNPYAITSDIKKAFLQIGVVQEDRDYLRFLWYEDGKIIVLRHCRVVFGISSSPFLLAATINHHLEKTKEEWQGSAQLLKRSIYVDNCVASLNTKEGREKFKEESTKICAQAKFELRGWEWNDDVVSGVHNLHRNAYDSNKEVQKARSFISVLGLLWDTGKDLLSLDLRNISTHDNKIVTKRNILAATHQIYDPIGVLSPALILPKMLLQQVCKKKFKWDEGLPEEIAKKYLAWKNSLHELSKIRIPRWVGSTSESRNSVHVFTDASKNAYTSVAFIRSKNDNTTKVQLLLAKSRVSTIKPITIPRLELVACECGAKMADYICKTIDMTNTKLYLWTDSGNALSWIKRKENWQVFVYNRVKRINELTDCGNWRHIPGNMNPADLPSRGCSNKQLAESRWWEGPNWLKQDESFWPKSEIHCDEEIVMSEKRKVVVSHLVQETESERYLKYFSKFRKLVRMIAWMRRWKTYKRDEKHKGSLSITEENEAETCLWRMVQRESFGNTDKVLTQLNAEKDQCGLWRVKTKLLLREDTDLFRRPILLPKDHPAVIKLIEQEHLHMHHCGPQVLRNSLRERFWIINSRVATRRVISSCKRCVRFNAKKVTTPEASLPSNRVKNAGVFEVVGIDLGGPLYLVNNQKAWFVIFTCAVYRAAHLELVSSLSTAGFIQSFRRFIARRGRPEVVYTDNGSNFDGTENLMSRLNWDEIIMQSETRRIKWIFNPPSAPWWGGWWERIVAMIKQMLRKNLGRELLDYEEMTTILCDCEQLINPRPLTYISENPDELIPITPMMFLNEARSSEVVDLDQIESNAFRGRYKHRQEIRQELRDRFRKEYLSELLHRNVNKSGHQTINVGDVVIMEVENKKRVQWPMARVIQTFPSTDGIVRSVKIRVVTGKTTTELVRPTKRLYLLEASTDDIKEMVGETEIKILKDKVEIMEIPTEEQETLEATKPSEEEKETLEAKKASDEETDEKGKFTRSGRKLRKPERFGF